MSEPAAWSPETATAWAAQHGVEAPPTTNWKRPPALPPGNVKAWFASLSNLLSFSRRVAAIQSCSPVALVVRRVIFGDSKLERMLHVHFAAQRLHGEWFAPSDELLGLLP